ncbi:hypothetical protein AGMMS49992_18160 [Clostridia bacterium]|nr:hypothetical protein AGMMS49992_18160 [Clostridia bacterium]
MKKYLAIVIALIILSISLSTIAGSTDSAKDVLERIKEEFTYRNYEAVVNIYEVDMINRPPLERGDSALYYHYARAVIACNDNDFTEANRELANMPDDFEDVIYLRHYVRGLDYIRRDEFALAHEELLKAEGKWDSLDLIRTMPTPKPTRTPTPTPTPSPTPTPTQTPTPAPAPTPRCTICKDTL